ncbi:MAG: hypothetical protein ACAI35_27475 [Candidatus Methylacidiphilales bacterium]
MPVNPKLIEVGAQAFAAFIQDPEIVGRLLEKAGKMPNLQMPTMGGKFFWTNLVEHDGWRLQKHNLLGNCRILNPDGVRLAWGGETAMIKLMESLIPK